MTRTQELREDVTRWLESAPAVQSILGDAYGNVYGAGYGSEPVGVVPAARASESDASPLLAVAASINTTSRQNDLRTVEIQVRVATSGTYKWVDDTDGAVDVLYDLHDAVGDVLTTNQDGWTALGVQADDEIAPNDSVKRYLGATSFAFERTERHPMHVG